MPATSCPQAFCPALLSCLTPSRSPRLPRPPLLLKVRAEADSLRRDLTQQTQRLSELTAQLEQERGQSEWAAWCTWGAWGAGLGCSGGGGGELCVMSRKLALQVWTGGACLRLFNS